MVAPPHDQQVLDTTDDEQVATLHEAEPKRALMLKMDHNAPYKKVRDMFELVQAVGFHGILLKVSDKKE